MTKLNSTLDLQQPTDGSKLDKPKKNNKLRVPSDRHKVDPFSLSVFQRILLTTNGTITDILEAYLFEQIQLVKLSENSIDTEHDFPIIHVEKGDPTIERSILLRGKISRRNFIYAHTVVFVNNLDEQFKQELQNTNTSIGKLWLDRRVENFKEITDSGKEPAQELANYFCMEPDENLLFRTYIVYSQAKPTMIITEKFPESYFLQSF